MKKSELVNMIHSILLEYLEPEDMKYNLVFTRKQLNALMSALSAQYQGSKRDILGIPIQELMDIITTEIDKRNRHEKR